MKISYNSKLSLETMRHEFKKIGREDLVKYADELFDCHTNNITFEKLKAYCESNSKDIDALLLVHRCYQDGIGTYINKKKMFELEIIGAQANHPIFLADLCNSYIEGVLVPKDIKKAKELAEQVMKQKPNYLAYFMLAYICFFDEDNILDESKIFDEEKANELLKLASENDCPIATFLLFSRTFSDVYSDESDPNRFEKCISLLKRLETQSDKYGLKNDILNGYINYFNGLMIYYGDGIEQNIQEGIRLFNISADLLLPDAQLLLLAIYEHYSQNDPVNFDSKKILSLFLSAVEQDSENWNKNLESNRGISKNFAEFINKERKNLAEEFEAYYMKCKMESKFEPFDHITFFNLAQCYKLGIGTKESMAKAVKWFKKSAQLGNEYAMIEMAECYKNGNGVSLEPNLALLYAKKAADEDDDFQETYLNLFESFEPVKNEVESFFKNNTIEPANTLSTLVANYAFDRSIQKIRIENEIFGFFTQYKTTQENVELNQSQNHYQYQRQNQKQELKRITNTILEFNLEKNVSDSLDNNENLENKENKVKLKI